MNTPAEHIVSVSFLGADFVVATDAFLRIKEIKLQGKWWPVQDICSVAFRQGLQMSIDAMPLDSERA